MSQRAKTRGVEIAATTHVFGQINAEKCIAYLRGIGVEVDDATADSWLDVQGVHRFLRSEKSSIRTGWVWSCSCGEMEGFSETGFRSAWRRWWAKKSKQNKDRPIPKCSSCGTGFSRCSRLYDVRRDGSFSDYRPADERWQPIAEYVAEKSKVRGDDDYDE